MANWKVLNTQEQQKHTLAHCQECCNEQQVLQQSFPLKPCYMDQPLVVVNAQKLKRLGKKEGTRTALAELNISFSGTYQSNFVDSLVAHGGERLQVTTNPHPHLSLPSFFLPPSFFSRPTPFHITCTTAIVLCILQVKPTRSCCTKEKLRTVYTKCHDKENEALKQLVPAAVLVEDESIRGKRSLQHFETPPAKRKTVKKSHSPNFESVTWDKQAVWRDLQQHPPAPPPINWQNFAREHNIPGG